MLGTGSWGTKPNVRFKVSESQMDWPNRLLAWTWMHGTCENDIVFTDIYIKKYNVTWFVHFYTSTIWCITQTTCCSVGLEFKLIKANKVAKCF